MVGESGLPIQPRLSGRLAVPFKTRTAVDGGVYLVFRAEDRRRALFAEIGAFLREQYAALPALPPGRIVASDEVRRATRDAK